MEEENEEEYISMDSEDYEAFIVLDSANLFRLDLMTCALLRGHDIGEEDRNNSNNYHSDLHVRISSNAAPAFIGRTFYAFSVCDPICKWFCRHQSHSSYRDLRPTPIGYCTHRILVA